MPMDSFNRRSSARKDTDLVANIRVEVRNGSGLHMNIEDALTGLLVKDDNGTVVAIIRDAEVNR